MTENPSPAEKTTPAGKKKGLSRILKWLAIAVGALSFAFVVLVIVSPDTDPAQAEPEEAAAAAFEPEEVIAEDVDAEAKPISDLDFGQLRDNWLFLSVEEWDTYIEPLVGQRVGWSGWVMNADTPGELWIDMDAPDDAEDIVDVILSIPEEDAALYSYDQEIAFEGDIVSFGDDINALDVRLNGVVVRP